VEFKFDPNQEFQARAIESVTDLLEGQPRVQVELSPALGAGLAAILNRLDLDENTLLANLRSVQERNGLTPDEALQCIDETIETASGSKQARFPNFSVEMETGTGKTYVYLRTALELYQRYGMRKFIVVVPSVAIREGVLKTMRITERHLLELHGNPPYRFYVYDADNLSQVRQFALSDGVEIMVMTIDSFNKASNVINQSTDRLQGETPIHLVQAARPILILDEPQNMESELRVKALSALDPLFALRYSATHRNPYNVVYKLTPFEAYRQSLVKRIEVASVVSEDDANVPFIRLEEISARKNTITARVAIQKLMKSGVIKEQVVIVTHGEALEEKAGRPEYAGFVVDEISPAGGYVRFTNNVELKVGESKGADRGAIFEAQIRYTVEEHLRKQARLRPYGVKVLSLFFIDRVDNYAQEDGIIRKLFVKSFNELKQTHPGWTGVSPGQIQAAYFAERRRRGGIIEMLDSVTGESKADEAAYDLIMRDKERLLSFDEPVAFIFSHSALREGWDNPNVFQICTLNQTASEIKKRQEIGRGVRLAVDQSGDRIHDERVNVLTVVANESYERYVQKLQTEIEEEYGKEGLPPKPADARKRGTVRLRKECLLKPEFKEMWERIKHKTRYVVKIETEKLLDEVVPPVDKMEIRPPRVTVTKAMVQVGKADVFEALQMTASKAAVALAGRYPLPNLIAIMENLMERTTPRVRLTRRTLLEVFHRTSNKEAALENPHEFALGTVRIIKEKLADHLVNGIRYEKNGEWYEMSQLEGDEVIESWKEYLVPAQRSIYDHVVFESEVERTFVEGLEKRDDVKLYFKLPGWFTVKTPVGDYNPDWAIVMEERDAHGQPTGKSLLYLVRETKAENWRRDLRPDEVRRIVCGGRHFNDALGVDYSVVSTAGELP
jgi:type III restriction enzyme